MYNTFMTEERIRCTSQELEEFRKSRVWLEIAGRLEARRDGLADELDVADNELDVKLIQRERRVLKALLMLPEILLEMLQLQDENEKELSDAEDYANE